MIKTFVKKPVKVQAVQWTGYKSSNRRKIQFICCIYFD